MFKTFKGRLSAIYFLLVSLIVVSCVIGITFLVNTQKSIDEIINTNYYSIERLSKMENIIGEQQNTILELIFNESQDFNFKFQERSINFYEVYNEEFATIEGSNEKQLIENIDVYYKNFVVRVEELNALKEEGVSDDNLYRYYYSSILPSVFAVANEITALSIYNSDAILQKRQDSLNTTSNYLVVAIVLMFFVIVIGLIFSKIYTKNLLKPVVDIIKTAKQTKNISFSGSVDMENTDEILLLTEEFKSMLKRIEEFEKDALDSLADEKNRSLAIVKSIVEPLLVVDSKGIILLVNDSFKQVYNISEMSITGTPLEQHFASSDLLKIFRTFEHSAGVEENIICAGNIFYNAVFTPMYDDENKLVNVIIILHNVTKFKELERIRGDFIATISHEFKTPLTSMTMGIDLIDNPYCGFLSEEQREIVGTIKEDITRLTNLTTDLIELSKAQSAKTVYDFKKCNLNNIIKASMQQFISLACKKNIDLKWSCPEQPPYIIADTNKITWVLNNLLSNALKFTNDGGEVALRAWQENKMVYVSVSDNGIGISKERKQNIFNGYVMSLADDNEMRGGGVGLIVSAEIIKAHDGEIWCDSEEQKGSVFTFCLKEV